MFRYAQNRRFSNIIFIVNEPIRGRSRRQTRKHSHSETTPVSSADHKKCIAETKIDRRRQKKNQIDNHYFTWCWLSRRSTQILSWRIVGHISIWARILCSRELPAMSSNESRENNHALSHFMYWNYESAALAIATHCHRTKCEQFNVIGEYFKCGDGTVLSPPNMNEILSWLSLVARRVSQAAHTTGVDGVRLAVRSLWWMFQHLLFFHISAHNSFERPMTTLSLDLVVSRRKNE